MLRIARWAGMFCALMLVPSSLFAQGGGLAVLAGPADEQPSPSELVRHLGTFDRERTPLVEQRFLLVNRGSAPVEIAKLQGSCGCTDLALFPGDRRAPAGKQGAPPLSQSEGKTGGTLAPGQRATLRAQINLSRLATGTFHKYIWAFRPGEANAALTISLEITVESRLTTTTRQVDFGRVRAGEARTAPFSVTIDGDLLRGARPTLAITSTNEDVSVRPVGGSQTTFQNGRAVIEQAYEVSLSPHAALGEVAGMLVLRAGSDSHNGATPRAVAFLRGQVEGEVRASPGTILFGAVSAAQNPRQRATLLLDAPAISGGLKVSTSAPWLAARLLTVQNSPSATVILETELKPQTPAGAVEATVTVTTAAGHRLVLPVLGVVGR